MWINLFLLLIAAGIFIVWVVKRQRRRGHEAQQKGREDVQQEQDGIKPPIHTPGETPLEGPEGPSKAQTFGPKEDEILPTVPEEVEPIPQKETQTTAIPKMEPPSPEKTDSTEGHGTQEIQHNGIRSQAVSGESEQITRKTAQTVQAVAPGTTPEGLSKPALDEDTQQEIAEEPRPATPIQEKLRMQTGRQRPVHRGGRPHGSIQYHKRCADRETPSHRPRPEIVCWKRGRQWFVGVEVPEWHIREGDNFEIYQDNSPLSPDDSREGRWLLESITGQVTIKWNEGEDNLTLGKTPYLLFKLSGQGLNQARLVKSVSFQSHIAIVPDSWQRDEIVSGPASLMPEPVAIQGYRAHFFDLEKDSDTGIAFRTPKGEPAVLSSGAVRFELVGMQLEDAGEDRGPFFSGIPKIRATDARSWKRVKTIVVGEAGEGRGRWRMEFSPDAHGKEQGLPSEILDRKGGWYFLRFHDENDDLLTSIDFQFLSGLHGIKMPDSSPFPGTPDGHTWARVEFFHDPEMVIHSKDHIQDLQVKREAQKTIVMIPPSPQYNVTQWDIGYPDGHRVQVTILTERIWWTLGEEGVLPSGWVDRPLSLSREDFSAISKRTLWLRLPKKRWTDKVLVGFQQSSARAYKVKRTEETVSIPLRDFTDCQELQHSGTTPISVWICPHKTECYKGTPCELTITLRCKLCDFEGLQEEKIVSHLVSSHLSDLFPPLSYDELRNHIPSLPNKIYKCSYCNYYVRTNDLDNPTSAICTHIEKDCQKAPREKGPPRISFRPISDPDEIRENVISNLPRMYKCYLCGKVLKDPTDMERANHLVSNHRNEVYELR